MTNMSDPRIEVHENGRRIPAAPHPPLLSASSLLGEGVILEKHVTPQAAEYPEREHLTHVLFLYEGWPSRVDYRLDGQHYESQIRSGHIWIIPRGVPVYSYFHGPHGGVLLSIMPPQFERHVTPLMHGGKIELNPKFNFRDAQLEYLLRGLLAVAEDGPQGDALVGDLLVNAACIRMAKHHAISKLNHAPQRGGLPMSRLKKVFDFIEANLDKEIRLTSLASAANMSLYYFATLFRQSTGLSPHQYVLIRRIERAKQLLRSTKLSVLEVGLNLGFEHQNNFARAFRRVTGTTPTHFRREQR